MGVVGPTDDGYHSNEGRAFSNEGNEPISNGSKKGDGFHKMNDEGYPSDGDYSLTDAASENPTGPAQNGPDENSGGGGRQDPDVDNGDVLKPEPPTSLLAVPHVRVLLFMQGLYSVRGAGFVLRATP